MLGVVEKTLKLRSKDALPHRVHHLPRGTAGRHLIGPIALVKARVLVGERPHEQSEALALLTSTVNVFGITNATCDEHLFELIHQSLISYDDQARPLPRVAKALPSLDDGTWRVFADGTMETVWQLRDNVWWHDGRPQTAEDVIFSWNVFNDTALPIVSRRVARLIDSLPGLRNFVGGAAVDTLDGRTTDVVDPATGEAYTRAPVSGPADVDAASRDAGRTTRCRWSPRNSRK